LCFFIPRIRLQVLPALIWLARPIILSGPEIVAKPKILSNAILLQDDSHIHIVSHPKKANRRCWWMKNPIRTIQDVGLKLHMGVEPEKMVGNLQTYWC
jgi:hypothetical protein